MFKPTSFTTEQLAEFHSRSYEMKLGYEDCSVLGIALCAERDQILNYLMSRTDPDCECDRCEATCARLRAVTGTLDTLKASMMATWPELCREDERRIVDDDARRAAADFLTKITGRPVSPEDITVAHVSDDADLDPADFARFSPFAGHG